MKFDILVIGSGPAGFYAALTCARGGLKTAIVENQSIGGTGFSTGCLPVKVLLDKLRAINTAKSLRGMETIDFAPLYSAAMNDMSDFKKKTEDHERKRLEECGVEIFHSEGYFKNKQTYVIDKGELVFDKAIIATGTEPAAIGTCQFSSRVISHKEAVILKQIPEKILIVGGDVEGIEFSTIFSQLGSEVTVLEQLPEILPGYDRDLVGPVEKVLHNEQVKMHCSCSVTSIEDNGDTVSVYSGAEKYQSDMVLITGLRKPSLPVGLENLGVKLSSGSISVDDTFKTSIDGIYAIGDINGILGMAGAAIQQAVQLSELILNGDAIQQDYSILPRAVFTIPVICGAGIQEKEISGSENKYTVMKFLIEDSWRHINSNDSNNFVKVIIDTEGIVKGIWFVGDKADLYGSSAGIIINNKTSVESLRRDLYIHPTTFESLFEAGLS